MLQVNSGKRGISVVSTSMVPEYGINCRVSTYVILYALLCVLCYEMLSTSIMIATISFSGYLFVWLIFQWEDDLMQIGLQGSAKTFDILSDTESILSSTESIYCYCHLYVHWYNHYLYLLVSPWHDHVACHSWMITKAIKNMVTLARCHFLFPGCIMITFWEDYTFR